VDSDDRMNDDELARSSHGLFKLLLWMLPRGTEENHKNSVGMVSVPVEM
jgi:hypothetical protein